ncbi:aminotransferase class III-fold pyridoxal phosphate-dependent enzyme [Pseudoflavitalea sp. G-6-1-2]|uniref:aminotransferase class III-fold pyridoxal phosphate-dependent enzyme n=1 Tax=Pseudoflavitalea sp. G-6-1-2 TaxID=2728841 RepID=UPI00146D64A5|nr:aminotransferase class III-fold pyridoxal phosphate-dependent enzyme [Pseudoflavitalea sp. G-6-1-2]NML23483.1 aminotransferase class III-fold pyridoxal phosphate-dependent enzyme [Pseudoflavitalea sp. G-6-1-2]
MKFSTEAASSLVKEYFGIDGVAKDLNGYDEWNYLFTSAEGKKYIFKIGNEEHGASFLDAQVRITSHLAETSVGSKVQQHVPALNGQSLIPVAIDGKQYFLRLLTFLEGTFWVDNTSRPDGLYEDLGSVLGAMDKALIGFSHTAMHRRYTWDISAAADANKKLHYIRDHHQRRIAGYFLLQFDTLVQPVISSLRHAYIHNDANDYNVLVRDGKIAGIIDFGDMVYTALINNLAIACTYAMFDTADPLKAAALTVKGYHQQYALTEQETDLLYYLIAARLCISVTQSAWNSAQGSTNEHHFITEAAAWKLLHYLIELNPVKAQDAFRKACGFSSLINKEDNYTDLLTERKKLIGRNLSISYDKPLKIVRGALQYLYDDKGDTYIDCVNNVSHVGHCHPVVVRAMQQQIATLNTNTRYLHDALEEFAAQLTATLPGKLKVCYFTNSGSEANDLAIRMSRHFTKQQDVIVLDHAYHGTSTVAIELSPYKFDGKGGPGQKPWVHKAISPDLYRGEYQYGDAQAGEKYAADVQRIIEGLQKENKGVAAFICETLLGVGGQIPLPDNYLKNVYAHVKAAGGICIADEVQVGFGRVGDKFWGFQLQDVEPDIVVLGKPIGNGHPLAAVVVTEEIANAFNNGMEYFNTFGGNPVSMVTGATVLNVIQQEEMQRHAKETGDYMLQLLKELMPKYPIISDVRGHGLFVGAELVKDQTTKEPAVPEIDFIVQRMKERGFLLSTDGPLHNVLKIKPPLVFTKDNASQMVKHLDEVLAAMQ